MAEYKHYHPESGKASEEVTTLNGKGKYWRLSVPIPFISGLVVKRYKCGCGEKFPSQDSYELHYRRAYYEEEMMATEAPHA